MTDFEIDKIEAQRLALINQVFTQQKRRLSLLFSFIWYLLVYGVTVTVTTEQVARRRIIF